MMLFGGERLISTCCPYVITDYNDAWVLTNANGLGGTPTWMQLSPAGGPPDPRSRHSAIYDPTGNRLIVYGGNKWNQAAQTHSALGDLWQLSNANGLGGAPVWTQIAASGAGPGQNRAHAAVFDTARQRMILFGGADRNGTAHKRVWILIFARAVSIDIKPGGYPNSVNLGSNGNIPVAIISSPTFDATTVNPSTVTLAGATVKLKGQGAPIVSQQDVNGDGRLDLLVHVSTEALQLTEGDTEAVLEGLTYDGVQIRGVDTVRVVR